MERPFPKQKFKGFSKRSFRNFFLNGKRPCPYPNRNLDFEFIHRLPACDTTLLLFLIIINIDIIIVIIIIITISL